MALDTDTKVVRQAIRSGVGHYRTLVGERLSYVKADLWEVHQARINNPHGTTKEQVGLLLVENYPIADILALTEGASATLYVRPTHIPDAVAAHTSGINYNMFFGTPVIQTPEGGAVNVARYPTVLATPYTVTPSQNLEFLNREYEIDLLDGDWSFPVAQWLSLDDGESVCPVALSYNLPYKVRVRDRSVSEDVSNWSLPVGFTTQQYAVYPLTITNPINGGAGAFGSEIVWDTVRVSDPEQMYSLLHYELQLSYGAEFTAVIKTVTTSSIRYAIVPADGLSSEQVVYLRVRPVWSNTSRLPTWSPTVSFTIGARETLPLIFTSASSGDFLSRTTDIKWTPYTTVDPEGRYVFSHYQLQTSNTPDFNDFTGVIQSSTTWRAPESWVFGQVYYLRVRAVWNEGAVTPWSDVLDVMYLDSEKEGMYLEFRGLRNYTLAHAIAAHDGGTLLYHQWQDDSGGYFPKWSSWQQFFYDKNDPWWWHKNNVMGSIVGCVEWLRADGSRAMYQWTPSPTNPAVSFPNLACWVASENKYLAYLDFETTDNDRGSVIYWVGDDFEVVTSGSNPLRWVGLLNTDVDAGGLTARPYYLGGEIYAAVQHRSGQAPLEQFKASIEHLDLQLATTSALQVYDTIETLEDVLEAPAEYRAHLRLMPLASYGGQLMMSYGRSSESENDVYHASVLLVGLDLSTVDNKSIHQTKSGPTEQWGDIIPMAIIDGVVVSPDNYWSISENALVLTKRPIGTQRAVVRTSDYSPLGMPTYTVGSSAIGSFGGGAVAESTGFVSERYLTQTAGFTSTLTADAFVINPYGNRPVFGYFSISEDDSDSGFVDWFTEFDVASHSLGDIHPYDSTLVWNTVSTVVESTNYTAQDTRVIQGASQSTVTLGTTAPEDVATANQALVRISPVVLTSVPYFLR